MQIAKNLHNFATAPHTAGWACNDRLLHSSKFPTHAFSLASGAAECAHCAVIIIIIII